ncbi:MAG: hypothetical protein RRB13_08780 [bacterium]|nr:hypothetical protein [bacterium]
MKLIRIFLPALLVLVALFKLSPNWLPLFFPVAPLEVPPRLKQAAYYSWSGSNHTGTQNAQSIVQLDGVQGIYLDSQSEKNHFPLIAEPKPEPAGETILMKIRLLDARRQLLGLSTVSFHNLMFAPNTEGTGPSNSLWFNSDRMTLHYSGSTGGFWAPDQSLSVSNDLWIASVVDAAQRKHRFYLDAQLVKESDFIPAGLYQPSVHIALGKGQKPETSAEAVVPLAAFFDHPLTHQDIRALQAQVDAQTEGWAKQYWIEQAFDALFWFLLFLWLSFERNLVGTLLLPLPQWIWHQYLLLKRDGRRKRIEREAKRHGLYRPGMDLEELQLAVIQKFDPTVSDLTLGLDQLDQLFEEASMALTPINSPKK